MFFVIAGAFVAGALLILLIASSGPSPALTAHEDRAPMTPQALEGWVVRFLEGLGLEIEEVRPADEGGVAEIVARNPTPVVGGQILVHCLLRRADAVIQPQDVSAFIDVVRASGVTKGLFFTTAEIPPEVAALAREAPVELFDGSSLARLVEKGR